MLLIVLAVAFVIVFAYRRFAAGSEDDLVHADDTTGSVIAKQAATARQMDQLDRIVNILGIVLLVYAVALGCFLAYQSLANGGKLT
jgi:hypothetical protein